MKNNDLNILPFCGSGPVIKSWSLRAIFCGMWVMRYGSSQRENKAIVSKDEVI